LTTMGRRSGELRTTPLIYGRRGDDYLVVASNDGSDTPPGWYFNLTEHPEVTVQIRGDRFTARARTATADERPELWQEMVGRFAGYEDYQRKANREISVVVLERLCTPSPWQRGSGRSERLKQAGCRPTVRTACEHRTCPASARA